MKEYTIERLKKCIPLTEGNYEDIDKDMIPILTELNEKGYKTRFCCQGHVIDGFFDTYIQFLNNYTFNEEPIYSSKEPSKYGYVYRWQGIKENDEEAERVRKTVIDYLTEWSEELEKREPKYFLVGFKGSKSKWLGKKITEDEAEKIKKDTDGKYSFYSMWESVTD